MDAHGLETLLAVALVAALAPIIVTAVPALRIPQVVVLIVAGILIGPHGLGLADTPGIKLLSNVGLGFLFLLAGYDFDPALLRQHAGRLAIAGWAMSCVIAVAAVASLGATGFVRDFVPIGLALTTTALGIVAPILRDNAMVSGQFGRYVMAAGAVGELFPIIAISLFLSRRGEFVAIASILAVCLAAILLSVLPRIIGDARLRALIRQGRRATAQTTLRWSIVLLLLLLVAAGRFGLDVVLGAMLAGMVLRTWTRRMGVDDAPLEDKLDAVGYGFFIPVFFVVSGMTLDIGAILADPLRLLVFFVLLLVVRGLPSLLVYRRSMAAGRDDVYHGDHHAAAGRAGRDRPQRRRYASGERGGAGRGWRNVGADLSGDRRRSRLAWPRESGQPAGRTARGRTAGVRTARDRLSPLPRGWRCPGRRRCTWSQPPARRPVAAARAAAWW